MASKERLLWRFARLLGSSREGPESLLSIGKYAARPKCGRKLVGRRHQVKLTRSQLATEAVAPGATRRAFSRSPLPRPFRPFIGPTLKAGLGSIAVADDLSKVPEIRAKGASSKFLTSAPLETRGSATFCEAGIKNEFREATSRDLMAIDCHAALPKNSFWSA